MTTAFQINAFQNNAFQVNNVTTIIVAGGSADESRRKWLAHKEKKFRAAQKLRREYSQMATRSKDVAAQKILIAAISPYVSPETPEEIKKHNQAQYIFDAPPPAQRVNFELMLDNPFAAETFNRMIDQFLSLTQKNKMLYDIEQQKLRDEDDELLIMIASTLQ